MSLHAVILAAENRIRGRLFLLPTLILIGGLSAQGRNAAPALIGKVADPGVRVEMFESANLDRFLRAANKFLAAEDFENAIKVLQEVIEGRTGEFMLEGEESPKDPEKAGKPAKDGKTPAGRPNPTAAAKAALPIDEENPAYSVFSSDDRIYRPVARLCHELLASMPIEGIGLYRARFEAEANVAYQAAVRDADLTALEAVYNKHFVTLSAGRAMAAAADMLMDAGRFRAAIQTLENLLEIYPDESRREAGLRDLMLMVKVAVCYQQLGELDVAQAQIEATAERFPDASVRLMGELYTVKDMHRSELFDASSMVVTAPRERGAALDLRSAKSLVPLWEYRFLEPAPYRATKGNTNRSGRVVFGRNAGGAQVHGTRFPRHSKAKPGITVQFHEGRLVFMDSFRPVVHDLTSGRQVQAYGDPSLASYRPPTSNAIPRARTPIYDYFGNRTAFDADRFYFLEGYSKTTSSNSFRAIHTNRLVAYDKATGARVWRRENKDAKKRTTTYLATPTLYRKTLLVPFLDAGIYGLLSIDAATGAEVYKTYLHSGGTHFARAPAPPVVVEAGIAYVLTNAGVLGAVDANTGVLNWACKYERIHPDRGLRRRSVNRGMQAGPWGGRQFYAQAADFRGFVPGDLYVAGDLILLGAADSTVLLALNAATGEVVWMHNAEAPRQHQVLDGQIRSIVGHNDDYLFVVAGDSQLMCIGLRSGLRYWLAKLPGHDAEWRGRGCVTPDYVVMPGRPGAREIHVIAANQKKRPAFRTIELPDFSIGKEPFTGPCNLQVHDAYLAISYESGVELYSSPNALQTLSQNSETPGTRASYLVHAGMLEDAIQLLFKQLDRTDLSAKERRRKTIRVLSLVEEVSSLMATNKMREPALKLLAEAEKRIEDPRLILRVHLFRLQVYRALGDVAGVEKEQEFIENGGIQ